MSQQTFKQKLVEAKIYDPITDVCSVGSKQLQALVNFEIFWSRCTVEAARASYDLTEIVDVYNDWCDHKNVHITVEQAREWLHRHYPAHLTDTSIKGFSCTLWDKNVDIENALEAFPHTDPDVFEFYRMYTSAQSKRLVSKEYFYEYVHSR